MLWTMALVLLTPCLASADSPAGSTALAPPGPCAEPRDQALRADPVYNTAAAEDAPVFAISGSPRNHFDPVDVAGGPPRDVSPYRPQPNEFPSPCSTPDAGCANLLGGISESGAQPGDPPGVGGAQP
jgi:hypothetical protein